MEKGKLTIITSTYNSGTTLAMTLQSILSQSYRPLEYIIVDGASSDSTLDLIEEAKPKFQAAGIQFKGISEKDSGIYNAWNKGLKMATGDWISFLGSDDAYEENAVSRYANSIAVNPAADFICAKTKMYSNNKLVREFGEDFNWKVFKREMKILHAGSFLSKTYFDEYGHFDESYRITADYEMLLRKGSALQVIFIDEFLVRMGADGVSSSQIRSASLEAKRAKIEKGARSRLLAEFDYYWVRLKIALKNLMNGK